MTFWRSYAHLVWATKNRNPFIRPDFEKDLYACIVSKAAELGCYVHAINGMEEHVHVVTSIPPKHAVAWVVKNLKGSSAHFVNHVIQPVEFHFAWQRGYGYLSLGQTQCPRAVAYVERQKIHHRDNTTNPWLEKCTDTDSDVGELRKVGAAELGLEIPSTTLGLREERVTYTPGDTFPF